MTLEAKRWHGIWTTTLCRPHCFRARLVNCFWAEETVDKLGNLVGTCYFELSHMWSLGLYLRDPEHCGYGIVEIDTNLCGEWSIFVSQIGTAAALQGSVLSHLGWHTWVEGTPATLSQTPWTLPRLPLRGGNPWGYPADQQHFPPQDSSHVWPPVAFSICTCGLS